MKKPTKEFILWVQSGEGYTPTEYESVEEALIAEKYTSDWYLTQSINRVNAYANYDTPKEDKEV